MIEKLILVNFQIHRKLILLCDQITAITGQSDAGKSAIVRALVFILTNQPPDTNWVRHGAKEAKVVLFIDGQMVVRGWSRKQGHYYKFAGETFSAVGRGPVPDKIRQFFNISEINIQQQHDRHFLLGVSAGECGRIINRCAGLEIIDRSLACMGRKLLESTREFNRAEEDVREKKSQLLATKWAVQGRDDLFHIKGLSAQVRSYQNTERSLEILVEQITEEKQQISKYQNQIKRISPVIEGVDKAASQLTELQGRQRDITEVLEEVLSAEEIIKRGSAALKKLDGLLKGVKVCPLCGSKL